MKKFLVTCTLCLRFFACPIVIVSLLGVIEIAEEIHTMRYTQKVGISLAMYGIGTLIPYFISEEILHRRFGTISTDKGYKVEFFSEKEKEIFDLMKAFLWVVLVVGFVLWIANNLLPKRLIAQPLLANWFWITGVAYCFLVGIFYVFLNSEPNTNKPAVNGD